MPVTYANISLKLSKFNKKIYKKLLFKIDVYIITIYIKL